MTNNGSHLYYYDGVPSNLRQNSEDMLDSVYEPVNSIGMIRVDTETSVTDMVVHANDYTDFCGYNWNYYLGLAPCGTLVAGQQYCEKHNVYIDTGDTSNMSDREDKSLLCHEYGHTFGLQHRDAGNGCLTEILPSANFPNGLTDHDRGHLNGNY